MTDKERMLLRYVCDGDMKMVRRQAQYILETMSSKKDESFREDMLKKLTAWKGPIEIPGNLKGILVAENAEDFHENKFMLRGEEAAVVEKTLSIYRVADKLRDMGLPYVPALMLYGESGCGKTELARYIAHRAELPFLYVRFSALVNSYLGGTQANLAKIFDFVRSAPCVLCFDEIDAVGMARGQANDVGEMNRIVIALMQEMDRLPNNLIVIGTTNRYDRLDPALIRRFPFRYEVKRLSPEDAKELAWRIGEFAGVDPECLAYTYGESVTAANVVRDCVRKIAEYLMEQEATNAEGK